VTAVTEPIRLSTARLGSEGGRLLAGPAARESWPDHLGRLGPMPDGAESPRDLVDQLARSGLVGRGGGYFPLESKMRTALSSPGTPVVVVNACESEPAVRKDRLLLRHRPHLVLDGALAVAAALEADRVIIASHAGSFARASAALAATERPTRSIQVEFVDVPNTYIAGESTALVSFLNGGPALPPGRTVPTAVSGVDGRPTVVSNTETLAHAAMIARFGSAWFREAGSPDAPGSVLVTTAGDVRHEDVLEVVERVTVGEALEAAGGVRGEPQAVLVGGYAGTWVPAHRIWQAPLDAAFLRRLGAPLGCGLLGVVASDRCGLVETARLIGWLAGERAGQCGACTLGMPDLADRMLGLADGSRRGGKEVRRIVSLGETISGRGLCHLPDTAVAMAESALVTFADELKLHKQGRCSGRCDEPVFPVPERAA
jgi:NADH:ubiquinone oxidoreductase subunit F (NADH-binding)